MKFSDITCVTDTIFWDACCFKYSPYYYEYVFSMIKAFLWLYVYKTKVRLGIFSEYSIDMRCLKHRNILFRMLLNNKTNKKRVNGYLLSQMHIYNKNV